MIDDAKPTHTPEPWVYHEAQNGSIVHFNGETDTYTTVASYVEPDDADRIIKCVQAMSGITDPSAVPEFVAAITELSAFICFHTHLESNEWGISDTGPINRSFDRCNAALAAIKGVKS